MKNIFYMILVTILLVTAVGCTKQQSNTTTGKAFIGGNKGLSMSFLTGAPPESVFDTDNPFTISVKLENVGEYDIQAPADATVEITGIDPASFGTTAASMKKDSPETLKGASLDSSGKIIQGVSTTVDFDNLQYKSKVSGTVPFPLRASVCYEYGTKSQAKLCILKDLIGRTTEERFCNPNNENIAAESSSAPMQVTTMSENVLGANKVAFAFKIKNMGTGKSYQKATECNPSVPTRDKVWVEVTNTGLGDLTCSGLKDGTATTGYVTLYNDEASVRCTQTITDPRDSEKAVEVKLTYSYKEVIQKTLQVKQGS